MTGTGDHDDRNPHPGHIQNPKYASSSAVTGGGSPDISSGIFDFSDSDRSPKGPRSPIPCYVCDTADEDQSDLDVDDSEEEKAQDEGPTPEQKALSDAIARAATAKGSVEEVVLGTSEQDRNAVSGKKVVILYGKDDDTQETTDDEALIQKSKAFPEVAANAKRLERILDELGANAESMEIAPNSMNSEADALVVMGHNNRPLGGMTLSDGGVLPYADAGLVASNAQAQGVVLWLACNGGDFLTASKDSGRYSVASTRAEFNQQPTYDQATRDGRILESRFKNFIAAGITVGGWQR